MRASSQIGADMHEEPSNFIPNPTRPGARTAPPSSRVCPGRSRRCRRPPASTRRSDLALTVAGGRRLGGVAGPRLMTRVGRNTRKWLGPLTGSAIAHVELRAGVAVVAGRPVRALRASDSRSPDCTCLRSGMVRRVHATGRPPAALPVAWQVSPAGAGVVVVAGGVAPSWASRMPAVAAGLQYEALIRARGWLQQTLLMQDPLAHWLPVVQAIPVDGS